MVRSQHFPKSIKIDAISKQDFINFNKVIRAVYNKFRCDNIDVFIVKDGIIFKKQAKEELTIHIYPSGDVETGMVRR